MRKTRRVLDRWWKEIQMIIIHPVVENHPLDG